MINFNLLASKEANKKVWNEIRFIHPVLRCCNHGCKPELSLYSHTICTGQKPVTLVSPYILLVLHPL